MSEHNCTICCKNLEVNEAVTTIEAGEVWQSGIIPCHAPNQEVLCQRCAQDLDKFLQALHKIRTDPLFKDYTDLPLQQFTARLVKKGD